MPELNMEQTRRQDGEEREEKRALSVLKLGPTMAIDGRTFRAPLEGVCRIQRGTCP